MLGTVESSVTDPVEDTALPDKIRLHLSVLTDEYDLDNFLPQTTIQERHFMEGHISPGDQVHVYGAQMAERTPEDPTIDGLVERGDTATVVQITAGEESSAVLPLVRKGIDCTILGLRLIGLVIYYVVHLI